MKLSGNKEFKLRNYEEAIYKYREAVGMCGNNHNDTKSKCYNNIGVCHKREENYEEAAKAFTKAIDLIENYVKARMFRAQCYSKIEKFDKSSADMKYLENLANELENKELLMRIQM